MSKKTLWPGVRRKTAKGKTYWYWAKVDKGAPWIALPDPYSDPDSFMRTIAHLGRVSQNIEQRRREGSFGALAKAYLASRQFADMAASSKKQYRHYIDRLVRAYGDAPLVDMTPENIQVHVMDANQDTPGAADMMLIILRTLYKFASKRNRGLDDWTAGIEKYGNQTERQPWPEHVLSAALASDDAPFRNAVALALYTGQRAGDTCAMTWNALRDGKVRVVQEKTGTGLEIVQHPALVPLLATIERSDRHLFILSNRRGDQLTPEVFWTWCRAFSAKYGLRLGPHGLRKNAVNALFESGCTAAEVASVSGHKSLAMLELYGRKRDQSKLSSKAMAKWAGDRNGTGTGKPATNRENRLNK